jgi:hypothetical protein
MQTKEQFLEKVEELIATATANLRQNAERLFSCGGMDPESYEDDYALPKIILCAALRDEANSWFPHNKEHRKDVQNLRHF